MNRQAVIGCRRLGLAMFLCALFCAAPAWSLTIKLPSPVRYPRVTATPGQLARLRRAYQSSVDWKKILAKKFINPTRQDIRHGINYSFKGHQINLPTNAANPIYFPPRGAQHVQWFRCPADHTPLEFIKMGEYRCPKDGQVYLGFPYDEVVYSAIHAQNLRAARMAAWAYVITGEKTFAHFSARILTGYGKRYKTYPYHDNRKRQGEKASRSGGHLNEQTLGEAAWLMRYIAPAYDLIRPTLNTTQRKVITDGLIRPMLKNIAKNPMGTSNWQSFHNSAMLWGGAVLGSQRWVNKAINDPRNGFLFQMKHAVTPDGVWHEGSWSYQRYTMTALAWTARGAANLGIDLWHNLALEKMYLVQMRYALPGGALPRFGDATDPHIKGAAVRVEPMYGATHDKRLIPLLPKKPGWLALLYGNLNVPARGVFVMPQASSSMPSAGDIVLRTNGKAKLALVASYDKNTSYHAHHDQLSFVLYGLGQELGVDPGREMPQAYNAPIHRRWYKSTLAHNTLWVDGQDQKPAPGKLLDCDWNKSYAAAVMQIKGAYKGVVQTRLLVMTPTYLLVFDRVTATKPHRYVWLYHNTGSKVETAGQLKPVNFSKQKNGLVYLKNTRQKKVDNKVTVHFQGDSVVTDVLLAAPGKVILTLANGPKMKIKNQVPMIMLTQKRNTWFAAVIRPRRRGHLENRIKLKVNQVGAHDWVFNIGDDVVHLTMDGRYQVSIERCGHLVLSP